jgi:transcriptional regulator with XRE-family HTH domain
MHYEPGWQERIYDARKRSGLTQVVLAKHLSCAHSLIAQWETGRAKPGQTLLARLAVVLGVTRNWLRLGSEESDEALELPTVEVRPGPKRTPPTVAEPLQAPVGVHSDLPGEPVCNPAFGWAGWRS